jgi:hypothetical protein
MKRIDRIYKKIRNEFPEKFAIKDKTKIFEPGKDIDFQMVEDKKIKKCFVVMYSSISDEHRIIFNKETVRYEKQYILNVTDRLIKKAFKALYPRIKVSNKVKRDGEIKVNKKNKEMNDIIRKAVKSKNIDIENTDNQDDNQNEGKTTSMNDLIRKQVNNASGLKTLNKKLFGGN